jgi:hypothetical protein
MSAFGSPYEDKGDIDREIRIEKMKRELEELSSESMISGSFGDVSPELEKIFLSASASSIRRSWIRISIG